MICNMYAPNNDEPEYFVCLFAQLDKFAEENVIVGGDFNLTLNPELDRYNSVHNNNKAMKQLCNIMTNFKITDVWCDRFPETKRYSWFRNRPGLSASRIDFMLVNQGIADCVENVEYCCGCRTNHSMIVMEVKINNYKRSKGVWKFNMQLLADDKFCDQIKNMINPKYEQCLQAGLSATEAWDSVKLRCAEIAQACAKTKCGMKRKLLQNLYILKDTVETGKCNISNTV